MFLLSFKCQFLSNLRWSAHPSTNMFAYEKITKIRKKETWLNWHIILFWLEIILCFAVLYEKVLSFYLLEDLFIFLSNVDNVVLIW